MSESLSKYDKVIAEGRGRCLDALITAITFNNFGVETKIIQTTLKPIIPDENGFAPIAGTVAEIALKEHRTVMIQNFGPRIERKIIRTRIFKVKS